VNDGDARGDRSKLKWLREVKLIKKNVQVYIRRPEILSENLVPQGTASLTGTDIAKKARQIAAEDKDAVWIGATDVNAQYLVANGIQTLNGINEWPNYDWIDKIDPGHSYEKVWNRYAHISIVLGTSTSFGLYQQDVYILQLSPSDLRKMGVTYIYTFSPYDDATIASNHLKLLYQGKNSRNYIYKVE
jgi:hypothetical protein